MGIDHGNLICQSLCSEALLFSVPALGIPVEFNPKTNVNLYIDGPILLYCGNLRNSQTDPINIINKKLRKIISVVASRYNILGVYVFFDGEAPREKAGRQLQRAGRGSTFNIQQVKQQFCKFNHFPPIVINNLQKGEAEMEMYRLRDTKTTSIIYTKDTDMFTIAYGHSEPDDVIFCQERLWPVGSSTKVYSFFDMRKFCYATLPSVVFSALMGFAGTDYTETRLSLTQVKCILEKCATSEFTFLGVMSEDPKIEDISTLVDRISDILRAHRSERRGGVCDSRNYGLIKESAYLDSILFYVRYIKYGLNDI